MFTTSWYEQPFALQPKDASTGLRAGQVVIDGVAKISPDLEEWNPRILSIGSKPTGGGISDFQHGVPTPSPGGVPLELQGLYRGGGGVWIRRFWAPAYRRVEIDVSGFADVRVAVLGTGAQPGLGIWCTVSNRLPPMDAHRDPVVWSETYGEPGTYATPPGALWALPSAPDPGFAWQTFVAGVAFPFAAPIVPGVAVDVRSGLFSTSVPGLTMLWGIRL